MIVHVTSTMHTSKIVPLTHSSSISLLFIHISHTFHSDGKIGITKFKSRSFEAWQKSGGKNLFPVDPSTPLEERPYMQRTGGQADGSDLKKKGLFGRGQGTGSTRLDVDDKYDNLEKEGKLRSFAFEVPWSNKQLEEQNKKKIEETRKATIAAKAKETKTAKKTPFSFGRKKAPEPEPEPVPEPKKKLFGLF